MIVVDNDTDFVIGYSHLKITINEQGHIICWNDEETWYGIADLTNYTIYEQQDLYPPSLEHTYKYIDGQFIEWDMETNEPAI